MKKAALSAIFAVFLAFCPARQPAQARYSQNGEADFSFEVKNGKAVITGYSGKSPGVVIPRRLGGVPVTEIGCKAFSYCAEYGASSGNRRGGGSRAARVYRKALRG